MTHAGSTFLARRTRCYSVDSGTAGPDSRSTPTRHPEMETRPQTASVEPPGLWLTSPGRASLEAAGLWDAG